MATISYFQVCEDVLLPRLNINDLIIFENMGAYSIVTATTFNGCPLPIVEYYIERKDWYVSGRKNLSYSIDYR